MIKFYLFKSEEKLEPKVFENLITNFYQGEYDLTFTSANAGFIVTEDRFAFLLAETVSIISHDLGTKIVFVCAHDENPISRCALDYAFTNLQGFHFLSDVVFEMLLSDLPGTKKIVITEFSHVPHELLLTAQAYIKAGLNAKAASDMLYIHRNTFNYRLDKFLQMTNLDLRDYWNAFYFNTYLRLLNK